MGDFRFADSYKAAGLAPGPDIIRFREEPFQQLRREMTSTRVIELTRLYFAFPGATSDASSWFRDAFAGTDPSFSLVNNQREAAVLAACLLAAALKDHVVAAGLAPLTAAAAGNRDPVALPGLLDDLDYELRAMATTSRQRSDIDPRIITPPAASELEFTAEELTNDWKETADVIMQSNEESREAVATLVDQVVQVVSPLAREYEALREEVDLLWWHVGGWSRILDRPFGELDLALASVMAGLDMAALTRRPPGGVATPALLYRTIMLGRASKSGKASTTNKVTIKAAVDAFPHDRFDQLCLDDRLRDAQDICPVLAAFLKASEIGPGPAWYGAFERSARLPADAAFNPRDLGLQAFREAMLVSLME